MTYLPGATATGLADAARDRDARSKPTRRRSCSTPRAESSSRTGSTSIRTPVADDQRAVMMHPAVLLENRAPLHRGLSRDCRRCRHRDSGAGSCSRRCATGRPAATRAWKSRRALYADIFAKLAAAGVPKDDLQIAWDFTTGSRESITGPLIAVRDAALGVVGSDGPEFTLKSVEENPNADILRRIVVTMKAPLFLESASYAAGDPVPALKRRCGGQTRAKRHDGRGRPDSNSEQRQDRGQTRTFAERPWSVRLQGRGPKRLSGEGGQRLALDHAGGRSVRVRGRRRRDRCGGAHHEARRSCPAFSRGRSRGT